MLLKISFKIANEILISYSLISTDNCVIYVHGHFFFKQ